MKSFMEAQVLLLQKKEALAGRLALTQADALRTHFCRRFPMKSFRQKTVRIITSASFFTDWIRAPTMVFRPVGRRQGEPAQGQRSPSDTATDKMAAASAAPALAKVNRAEEPGQKVGGGSNGPLGR